MNRFTTALRHPMVWLREMCGGEIRLPARRSVRSQRRRRARSHSVRHPAARNPRRLRHQTCALRSVSSALASVAALALQVPIAQLADRTKRVPLAIAGALLWSIFSGMTGSRHRSRHAHHRPLGLGHRQGRRRPDAQLVARRLLPARTRAAGCSASTASPTLSARSSGHWWPGCWRTRSGGGCRSSCSWYRRWSSSCSPCGCASRFAGAGNGPQPGPATRSSTPRRSQRRSSRAGASCTRFRACAGSGTRCRSSPSPSSASSRWRRCFYDQRVRSRRASSRHRRGDRRTVPDRRHLIGTRIITRRYMNNIKGLVKFISSMTIALAVASALFALAPNIVVAVDPQLRHLRRR